MLSVLWQDLRYAMRGLRRSPGFAAAAVASLALGIGFNSAVYSLVRAEMFPDAGIRAPEDLVDLRTVSPKGNLVDDMSVPEYLDYRASTSTLSEISAARFGRFSLSAPGETSFYVVASLVTPNYFAMAGVKMALGRGFLPDEDQPGRDHVVILPHPVWRNQFAANPAVIGSIVYLSLTDQPYRVVGVLPPSWRGGFRRIYLPLHFDVAELAPQSRSKRNVAVMGRLKRGVTMDTAKAEVAAIARRLQQEHPETNQGWLTEVTPEIPRLWDRLQDERNQLLAFLFAAVGFVLMLACVNVANLMLARGAVRRKEIAMRCALGASRGRIVRQWLTESLLLATLAGAVGLGLAVFGAEMVHRLWNANTLNWAPVSTLTVLGFTAGAALVSILMFGLIPAWQASASDAIAMHTGRTAHPRSLRLRDGLVVAEIALAVVMVAGAGLAVRSFVAHSRIDPGFDPHRLLAVRYQFVDAKYHDEQRQADFFRRAVERVSALPGVRAAAWVSAAPSLNDADDCLLRLEGEAPFTDKDAPHEKVDYRFVTRDYFRTMGLRFLAGRDFAASDSDKVIINEPMARRFFAGRNPLGQRLMLSAAKQEWLEIVGVVPPITGEDLRGMVRPQPEVILLSAAPSSGPWLMVRTEGNPAPVVPALREAIAEIDKDTPVANVQTIEQVIPEGMAPQRSLAGFLAIFGVLALVLAVVGVYGVMSYFVTQRSRDVGIRLALGAQSWDILRMVLARGARLAIGGVAIGAAVSVIVERLVAGLFFGVSGSSSGTLISAALVLLAAALAACAIPAGRAARLDPVSTLRAD